MNSNNQTTYRSEIADTLSELLKEYSRLRELRYFLDLTDRHFLPERMASARPRVIAAGTGVPEEIVLAAGETPFWVLGGSFGSLAWSEELVPRDADPIHRSILGFLENPAFGLTEDALIVLPAASDSARKMAFALTREGKNVLTLDVPPDRNDPASRGKWRAQAELLAEALEDSLRRRVTAGSLRRAFLLTGQARRQTREFLRLSREKTGLLSGAVAMAVVSSYYCAGDVAEWTRRLTLLNRELRAVPAPLAPEEPGVLLLGSPVLFPNYKVGFLIQETGLTIRAAVDATRQRLTAAPKLSGVGSRSGLLAAAADSAYENDASEAYIVNSALYDGALRELERGGVEGVVYHVLKGHVEVDFELERLEKLFESRDIPVFRLETDYQYQDVEQLRIRLEAFRELLTQRRGREAKRAI